MTSAERPDQIYGKGEPLDVNIDISRIKGAKVTMCRPDISEELPMPLGIDSPLVRQMLYSTKHLDAALDEAREHLPDRFKTNGELDIYKMVAGYHERANRNDREYKLENMVGNSPMTIVGLGRPAMSALMEHNKFNDGVLMAHTKLSKSVLQAGHLIKPTVLVMAPRLSGDKMISIDAIKGANIEDVYPKDYLIYNMVSALDVHQDPLEHAKRWQNDVRQLVNDWHCLPVRSERGDRLAREVMGMLNRRIASGSTGRSDRGLVSRMRSTLTMGKIANELIAVAAELGNGDSAAIMTESGQHCVFFLANPEGSFVGLCEMTEKLPTFIDGVPDYLYYAVISAIGWRGMKTIPHHLEGIIRKAMTFGGFGKDAFTQLEVVHHPEFVTKMPQHYAIGEISMDEVMRGVASPNTRPILIK